METAADNLGHNKLILFIDLFVLSIVSFLVVRFVYNVPFDTYIKQLLPALLVVGVSLYLVSAFEISLNVSLSSLLSRNIIAVAIAMAILLVAIYSLGPGSGRNVYGRGALALTMAIFVVYLLITRYLLFSYLRDKKPFHQWVYIGSDSNYLVLAEQIKKLSRHKINHQDVSWLSHSLGKDASIGIILDHGIFVHSDYSKQLVNAKFNGIKVISVDQFCESYLEKISLSHVEEDWFLNTAGFGYINDSIRQRVKRTIDLFVVVVTAPLTLFLFLLTAFAVLIKDRQNPVFCQQRVGQHGRSFNIFKLRTMRESTEHTAGAWAKENDLRITRLGKLLRRYRLDEIPQLYNVLMGNMSIIGPRPEQQTYTDLLKKEVPFYDIRHSVKPGITGWAQVKFPYGASVEDSRAKLEYDLYYIKNYSILLDISILIKTVHTVISGGGR